MYPNANKALAMLSQASELILEARSLLVPQVFIISPVAPQGGRYEVTKGQQVAMVGSISGNIVRIRVYDKNATVLADNITPAEDGSWSATLDTSNVAVDDNMWFTATGYDSPTADTGKVEQSLDVKCIASSSGGTGGTDGGSPGTNPSEVGPGDGTGGVSADPHAGTPAAGMTLIFGDTFDFPQVDESSWYLGGKPRGMGPQWGGAHFVTEDEIDLLDKVYASGVNDGKGLEIRAYHDEAYADPEGWGRKWYSGQMSTASPTDDMATFHEGYVEVRARLPASTGAWSGICLYSMYDNPNGVSDPGGMELDQEFYGDAKALVAYTIHDWPGNTGRMPMKDGGTDFYTDGVPDLTAGFNTFGMAVTASEVVMYLNGKETKRYPKPQQPSSPLWLTLDLAIQENHAVDLPGAKGYVSLDVEYVKMYKLR